MLKQYRVAGLLVLGGLVSMVPAFADSYTTFALPTDGVYIPSTTNYGGGDGSASAISSLGPFGFSSPLLEYTVPDSWSTWNCPPATESCTPNVLWTQGVDSLTLTLTGSYNTAGFELEPDQYQTESVSVSFYDENDVLIDTITLDPSGSSGALLFALFDYSPGQTIGSIQIVDNSEDDFAIAQLRAGNSTVPEPASIALLGTGLLALGLRRKFRAGK